MTARWLRCRNWEHWQTYRRDRNPPPWIKVHRRILQDMEWSMLTDAEKGQLVSMWVLAADRDGAIPDDARALQRLLGLDEPPDLPKFKELGFLTPEGRQGDANVTSDRDDKVASSGRQSDAPEPEADSQRRGEADPRGEETPRAPAGAPRNGGNGHAQHFDAFWALYPRRRDKKKAREVWIRKRLDERADTICQDVRHRQRLDDQWKRGYIPLPTTYLNGERWEDEFTQPDQGRARSGVDEWLEQKQREAGNG